MQAQVQVRWKMDVAVDAGRTLQYRKLCVLRSVKYTLHAWGFAFSISAQGDGGRVDRRA